MFGMDKAGGEFVAELLKGTETVLLVEDEQVVRALVSVSLTRNGYVVVEAANGMDALDIVAQSHTGIDLLLTDVMMPKMNGKELAEELKSLFPQIAVLFMSGYASNVIFQKGIAIEGTNFIQKPFIPEQLLVAVRKALNQPSNTATTP